MILRLDACGTKLIAGWPQPLLKTLHILATFIIFNHKEITKTVFLQSIHNFP